MTGRSFLRRRGKRRRRSRAFSSSLYMDILVDFWVKELYYFSLQFLIFDFDIGLFFKQICDTNIDF